MRRIGIGLAAVTALVLVSSPVMAKELNGRMGVGGLRNSLGAQGINFKYWAGHLGVSLMLGGASVGEQCLAEGTTRDSRSCGALDLNGANKGAETADRVETEMVVAARVSYNVARAKAANMFVGGGITAASWSLNPGVSGKDNLEEESSATELAFEGFLGAEYFFSNHFSFQAEVGLPFRSPSEDGPALGRLTGNGVVDPGKSGTGFGLGIPQWAAGFTFYFN